MTASPDRGTEAAPLGDPAALRAESERLTAESTRLATEAEVLFARSEILSTVMVAEFELQNAEAEVAAARDRLATATAAHDPIAADLARVEQELSATYVEGNLDQRLAARQRRVALLEELEPLTEAARAAEAGVRNAQSALRAFERDNLPHWQAVLASAQAAYDDPPLWDLGQLALVAPETATRRAMRIGLLLMYGSASADWKTAHGRQVRGTVETLLAASSLDGQLHDAWFARLLEEVGPQLAGKIRRAMRDQRDLRELARQQPVLDNRAGPVKLDDQGRPVGGLPDGYIEVNPVTGRPDAQLGPDRFPVLTDGPLPSLPGSPQQGDLPPVGSPGALESIARERRAAASDRRRMTGTSWATYPR